MNKTLKQSLQGVLWALALGLMINAWGMDPVNNEWGSDIKSEDFFTDEEESGSNSGSESASDTGSEFSDESDDEESDSEYTDDEDGWMEDGSLHSVYRLGGFEPSIPGTTVVTRAASSVPVVSIVDQQNREIESYEGFLRGTYTQIEPNGMEFATDSEEEINIELINQVLGNMYGDLRGFFAALSIPDISELVRFFDEFAVNTLAHVRQIAASPSQMGIDEATYVAARQTIDEALAILENTPTRNFEEINQAIFDAYQATWRLPNDFLDSLDEKCIYLGQLLDGSDPMISFKLLYMRWNEMAGSIDDKTNLCMTRIRFALLREYLRIMQGIFGYHIETLNLGDLVFLGGKTESLGGQMDLLQMHPEDLRERYWIHVDNFFKNI